MFRRFQFNLNQWAVWNYGWDRVGTGGNFNFNFSLLSYWGGFAGINRELDALAPGALRGGPAFIRPAGTNGWLGFFTDSRKTLRAHAFGFFFQQDESDTWEWGVFPDLSWRAATNMDFTVSPGFMKRFDSWQFLQRADALGSEHFVFGQLKQTRASMTFRGNFTFTPTLSLQLYAEPFVSSGDYIGFRQVADPRAERFVDRFDDFEPDRLIDEDGDISVDLNRDGAADIRLGNPDFTFLSFRSNVVLRWEYNLGSTLFLVWQHGRSGFMPDGRFRLRPSIDDLFAADEQNTLVIKLNYWVSL